MKFDCIVIGAGHNGLVAAAYLAKAGKSVCVLERRPILGGCSTSEALWPGYRVSTGAYVISLFQPQIIRDLALAQNGLTILPRDPSSYTPLPDGRSLTMGQDQAATMREIAKFSARDAEQFPAYVSILERVIAALEPTLARPAPDPLLSSRTLRKPGWQKKLRDLGSLLTLRRAMGSLGDVQADALELLTGAARPILERWFESEVLKATLATDAVIGAFAAPSTPGTAYVLLHHVMGEAGGARGVWGYVQGGMGGLADALEKVCLQLGVEIRRDAEVAKIHTQSGTARGVELTDGTVIDADVVASGVDAHLTFEKFIGAASLPADFRRAIGKIDYASASMKINLALSALPNFTADPSNGPAPHHRGSIHISPTLDYLERAFDEAKYGAPSREPMLEITLPSVVDPTIAPTGRHIMTMFVQYAPYELSNGSWDDIREQFADRCVDVLAEYAPNIKNIIEHRQVLSPPDLEVRFGITGGNIFQGAMLPGQLYSMRPVLGWADHRTPVHGLYLCGAASHPGGGVMGICGKNAAAAILQDSK